MTAHTSETHGQILIKAIVFQLAFTCSKSAKITLEHVSNIFKFNNTDTRRMFRASMVNFENISHFTLLLIFLNSNNLMLFGPEKLQFQKYIVLWTGKMFWAKWFYPYSPNISLQKNRFSQQHFQKISQTLTRLLALLNQ